MTTTRTWAFHWIVPDKVADDDIEAWAQREWVDEVGERAADDPEVTILLANIPPSLTHAGLRRPPRIVRVVGRVT